MVGDSTASFPIQKLPRSKKTKAWREATVDFIIDRSAASCNSPARVSKQEKQSCYDLYNGIYNEKDLKYVTNPFNQDDGFPAMALDYNIIKPSIDLLLGEETKRPFNFKVTRTSELANSDATDQLRKMLEDYVSATIYVKMHPEQAEQYQQAIQAGEILPPELIYKYISNDYKDIAEITATHSLAYLKLKLNLPHIFFKGIKDVLCGSEEIYYVGIINGNPTVEQVNPMFFDYDDSLDLEFIHEATWCCREMLMADTEVYDRFYDKMSEKQLNQLLDMIEDGSYGVSSQLRKTSMDFRHITNKPINGFNANPFDTRRQIKVWHVCWKSYGKIGFVTIMNPETGQIEEFQVDEYYRETGNEIDVTWEWVIEVWEGYRVGDDLYIGIGPLEYQYVSADNPNAARLPYTGAVYNNTNTRPKSLVGTLKPLQYMYIVLWYRLELALSRDRGKAPLIDVTQIPKSMGMDVNKWMHYLNALGVAFVNPYEEGWNIPGREGGKPSSFNQFQSLDMTMTSTVSQYVSLMQKIEEMVYSITGITPQRLGSVAASELVGNVQLAVTQSAYITEPIFWMHNQVKREVLSMLLNTAKWAWKDNKTCLNYIFDDMTRAFITLGDEFFYEDMDIFIDDSTKTQLDLELMRSFYQPAMQNGASLLDIAEVATLENVTLIRTKLQEIEEKRMQQQQAAEQAQQEFQAQMQQQLIAIQEEENALEMAKLDVQKYKIDQDNQTRIIVAELQAYRGTGELDQDGDGIPDPILIADQALKEREVDAKLSTQELSERNKAREIEMKRESEREKVQLEKEKLKTQVLIQRQKDKAALEREQLKATTALKNKVVGER